MDEQSLPHEAFSASATKRVTTTDKEKNAYVLTREQVLVLEAAGLTLSDVKPPPTVAIRILGESQGTTIASYYLSVREGSGRPPEPRLGRDFISQWLNVGDEVTLATDGTDLYAFRNDLQLSQPVASSAYRPMKHLGLSALRELLPLGYNSPPQRIVERTEYARSAAVVEIVLRRAKGCCEYPGCALELFDTKHGEKYLEVHHIQWLSEGGPDVPENAAALCPSCHRAMHYAVNRVERAARLREGIQPKLELDLSTDG